MVFFTQITMEAAEDPEFLAAMRRARIRGALVGIESVTPEGLKAVYKNFNDAGEALVTRLQAFRDARRARAGVVHLRTADRYGRHVRRHGRPGAAERRILRAVRHAHAVSRHGGLRQMGAAGGGDSHDQRDSAHPLLADTSSQRPKVYIAASDDVGGGHPAGHATRLGPFLCVAGHLAALDLCAIAPRACRVPADLEAVPADVRQHRHRHRQRARRAIGAARALARQGRAAPVRRRADAGPGRSCSASPHAGPSRMPCASFRRAKDCPLFNTGGFHGSLARAR